MILLVHLWCVAGQEAAFRAYEDVALRIFASYGGRVLEVLHPNAALSTPPVPYEIHRLHIASPADWEAFRTNDELQRLASLRATCIERTQIFFCPDSNS